MGWRNRAWSGLLPIEAWYSDDAGNGGDVAFYEIELIGEKKTLPLRREGSVTPISWGVINGGLMVDLDPINDLEPLAIRCPHCGTPIAWVRSRCRGYRRGFMDSGQSGSLSDGSAEYEAASGDHVVCGNRGWLAAML